MTADKISNSISFLGAYGSPLLALDTHVCSIPPSLPLDGGQVYHK